MASGVWGLDVSKSSLKAVHLESVKGRVELVEIDVIEYTPVPSRDEAGLEQEIRMALSTFIGRHKPKGNLIAAALPTHATFNRFIKLPPAQPERLHSIVQYEAQQHIPFPINEVIWTYEKMERVYQPGEEIDVVLLAVKKELVDQFLALMSVSGIRVNIVQFAPVALYNYIMYEGVGERNFVILDVGANNTDLILVDDNKFWVRNLPIVGNDFTKAIQQKFDLPYAEAENLKVSVSGAQQAGKIFTALQPVLKDLVGEIHRSIGYYKSLAPLGKPSNFTKIVTVGNATRTAYFDEFISQRLQMEVIKLKEWKKIYIQPGVNQEILNKQLPAFGVATGLALQGLNVTTNRINLLPPELIKTAQAQKRKPLIAAMAGLIALILIMLYFSGKNTLSSLDTAYQNARTKNTGYDKTKTALDKITKGIEPLKTQLMGISKIAPDRGIYLKIIDSFNKIPALQKSGPVFANDYLEKENEADIRQLKKFEEDKIWILKWSVEIREEKNRAGVMEQVTALTITGGLVARNGEDGKPNSKNSFDFMQKNLTEPLVVELEARGLKLSEPPKAKPGELVSQLRLPEESKGTPPASEGEKQYFLFDVVITLSL